MPKDVSKMSTLEACQTHIKDAKALINKIESDLNSYDPEFDGCNWAVVGDLGVLVDLLEQAANV